MSMKGAKEMARSKRYLKAEENYRRLAEKIAPFVKRRKFEKVSTTGGWHEGAAPHDPEFCATRGLAF